MSNWQHPYSDEEVKRLFAIADQYAEVLGPEWFDCEHGYFAAGGSMFCPQCFAEGGSRFTKVSS